jgi:hypothetical protein
MKLWPFAHLKPAHILFALILILIVASGPRGAKAEETGESTEHPESSGGVLSFIDTYHSYLEDKLRGPTIWFDNFFGDRRIEEVDPPSTFLRLRTSSRFTECEGFRFPVRVNANVILPKVNHRLRLIVIGSSQEDNLGPRTDQTIDSSLRDENGNEQSSLGLRYMVYKTMRDYFHFGGGLTVGWPMESYIKMQYIRLLHLGNNNVVSLSATGYWNTLHGTGETSRLDLERALPASITGRLSLYATFQNNNNGLNWGAETNFFRQLSTKSALSLDLGAYGETRPNLINTYRIASRYRRNFLRPWLFFEIEPELLFPLEADNETRQAIGVLTLTLECQFYTSDKSGNSE